MLTVIALGGNALLKKGETPDVETQRLNVKRAAVAIVEVINAGHQVVITHGNGPQVGLLGLQSHAFSPEHPIPLDVLTAETVGMIGYLIEQELANLLPPNHPLATLLTMIEVDAHDPAFGNPTKPIGPAYDKVQAERIGKERGWHMKPAGTIFRRVVPSPQPIRILEMPVVKTLVNMGTTVICAGGGGIPVVRDAGQTFKGVEAVIDKDLASAALAIQLKADALIMLTDVEGVYRDWGTAEQELIAQLPLAELKNYTFEAGSIGPKVEAAEKFVRGGGQIAGIGGLTRALDIVENRSGTRVTLKSVTADVTGASRTAEIS
jgi:carbamate kinase